MTTTAERVAAAMRAHDHQAPRTLHWAPSTPPPRRTHGRLLAVAATVVALVAGGVAAAVWWPSTRTATAPVATTPLTCPTAWGGPALWTPSDPAGVDTDGHLVPAATPVAAVVCAYRVPDPTNTASTATASPVVATDLHGDLSGIPAQWRDLPTSAGVEVLCGGVGVAFDEYRLVGLTYAGGGTVWVAAPSNGGCPGSSNGVFVSRVGLTASVDAWAAAGAVTTPVPTDDCAAPGRLGDDTAMVPGTPDRATVCAHSELTGTTTTTDLDAAATADLVAAVDAVPGTVSATLPCDVDAGPPRTDHTLRFDYPTGPSVSVSLPAHCASITNGVRVTDGVGDVPTVLARVLPGG